MIYTDFEEMVREFFECSLKNNFDEFMWDDAWEYLLGPMERKVADHGLLGADALRESLEYFGDLEDTIPDWAAIQSDYVHISKYECVDALVNLMVEKLTNAFESSHGELKDLYERLQSPPHDLPSQIQLFDECIHAQHLTGAIYEDCDPDDIRKEVEEEHESYVTNMRDFL